MEETHVATRSEAKFGEADIARAVVQFAVPVVLPAAGPPPKASATTQAPPTPSP